MFDAVRNTDCNRDEMIERMVRQWQVPLLRLCYIQLRDQALAEDAVQETFLKAYRGLASFREDCSEKTWLTRIAINTCRDMQRSGWFRHVDRHITTDMLPEPSIMPEEQQYDLTLAVMKLPYKYREVIILYYYQRMDTYEISTVLDLAQSSVSNRLRKGREMLRKVLEGRGTDA